MTSNEAKRGGRTPNRQGLYAKTAVHADLAVNSLVDLIKNSKNDSVRISACKSILDKCLPDLKAVEATGDIHRPIGVVILPEQESVHVDGGEKLQQDQIETFFRSQGLKR